MSKISSNIVFMSSSLYHIFCKFEDHAAKGIREKKNSLITKEHFVTDLQGLEKTPTSTCEKLSCARLSCSRLT